MKNKKENFESGSFNKYDGEEAYQTLVNWVKSVPNAIKEIEQNGSKEELIRYKKQVKMVVEKLKDIKNNLPNVNRWIPIYSFIYKLEQLFVKYYIE